MNEFATIYYIFWSIGALVMGIFAVFFTNTFIDGNKKGFEFLYKKTNIYLFKRQAEEIAKPYIKILFRCIGIAFMILGVITFLNNI